MSERDEMYITGLYTARHIASRTLSDVYARLLGMDDRRGARIVLDAADEVRMAIDAKIADKRKNEEVAGE